MTGLVTHYLILCAGSQGSPPSAALVILCHGVSWFDRDCPCSPPGSCVKGLDPEEHCQEVEALLEEEAHRKEYLAPFLPVPASWLL